MTPFAPLLADVGDGWLWLALFIAGLIVIVFVLRRHAAMRQRSSGNPARPASADQELRRSMDQLLVELQETSREINATIDTKTAVLNKLIEDADRRIETLKAMESKTPIGQTGMSAPPSAPVSDEARRRAEIEREILRLADSGKTELEIARATGVPRGEVELVLSLRRPPGTEGTARP